LEQQSIAGKLNRFERVAVIKRLREIESKKEETLDKIDQHHVQIEAMCNNLRALEANSSRYWLRY
jgi:hypothetical protein